MTFRMQSLDRALGIFLIFFSIFIYVYTYSFDYPRGGGIMVNIAFFPRFLAALLFILSIPLVVKKPDQEDERISIAKEAKLISIYLSFIGYTLLLNTLGFLIDTLIWVGYMTWLVGERKGWVIFITAFLGTGVAYFLFWTILGVPLPEGNIMAFLGLV
ncbi:MAG: tripartite tricarboxylate transporter TctB family protein [Deltaproteobacteria bacterium]|nr:tripartite tricarboxylate transporter TctB family protein [Deltaproteobacteria bacterium]MBW1960345.1 tripartite tricarboxylate transporter TctB family protein [Deltaproteobacteria bacterium]MBW1995566.1 tripartite tricarboxylate transporter TctB family protein [Deltaproteobacteria bacterium]MBW2152581.1 tripartite tricarboxylate transporter TctB family protein [Deltaproteobacteria bacterium]